MHHAPPRLRLRRRRSGDLIHFLAHLLAIKRNAFVSSSHSLCPVLPVRSSEAELVLVEAGHPNVYDRNVSVGARG